MPDSSFETEDRYPVLFEQARTRGFITERLTTMTFASYQFLLFFIVTIVLSAYSSEDVIEHKKYLYYSCSDTSKAYDLSAFSNVCKSLGMVKHPKANCSKGIVYWDKKLRWNFSFLEFKYDPKYLHPKLADLKNRCSCDDSLIVHAFWIYVPDDKRVRKNTLNFILSSYQQEIHPEIKEDSSIFFSLPVKNINNAMKYNWISPGLAGNYMRNGNPFSSFGPATTVAAYVLDAFGLAYVIGGPIFAKSTKSKIGWSLAGIGLLAEIRFLNGLELKREIGRYNAIRNSPYRVPISVKFIGGHE